MTRQGALAASPGMGTTYETACEQRGFRETTRTGPDGRGPTQEGSAEARRGPSYRGEQEPGQLPAVSDRRGPGAGSVQGTEDQRGKHVGGGGTAGRSTDLGPGTLEAGRTGAQQCPPHKVPSRHRGGLMVTPLLLQAFQVRPRRIKTHANTGSCKASASSRVEQGSPWPHGAVGDPEGTGEHASTGKAGTRAQRAQSRAWRTVLSKQWLWL